MKLSERMFEWRRAEDEFCGKLCDLGFGDFIEIGGDPYDNSIEIYQVRNNLRLSVEAQKLVFAEGFSKAYLNHNDKWETHYSWDRKTDFKPNKGWRRFRKNGNGFIVSYWPDDWHKYPDTKALLRSGYYEIQPDPLEIKVE